MVVFADQKMASRANAKLEKLRSDLGKTKEFKFGKLNPKQRLLIAQNIAQLEFRALVVVIDKTQLDSSVQVNTPDSYAWLIGQSFSEFQKSITNAKIRIDGNGSKVYKRQFKSYLRNLLPIGCVHDFAFEDSMKAVLIQLADFIAGLVHRHVQGQDQQGLLKSLIPNLVIKYLPAHTKEKPE
jgi:hypothetical protein